MFKRLSWHVVAPWQFAHLSLPQIICLDPHNQPLAKHKLQHALRQSWRSGLFAKFLNPSRQDAAEVHHCTCSERRCALARRLASSNQQVAALSAAFVPPPDMPSRFSSKPLTLVLLVPGAIARWLISISLSGPASTAIFNIDWGGPGCIGTAPARCLPTLRSYSGLCIVVKHACEIVMGLLSLPLLSGGRRPGQF